MIPPEIQVELSKLQTPVTFLPGTNPGEIKVDINLNTVVEKVWALASNYERKRCHARMVVGFERRDVVQDILDDILDPPRLEEGVITIKCVSCGIHIYAVKGREIKLCSECRMDQK